MDSGRERQGNKGYAEKESEAVANRMENVMNRDQSSGRRVQPRWMQERWAGGPGRVNQPGNEGRD